MSAPGCRYDKGAAAAFRSYGDAIVSIAKINHGNEDTRPRLEHDALIEDAVENLPQRGVFGFGPERQLHYLFLSAKLRTGAKHRIRSLPYRLGLNDR